MTYDDAIEILFLNMEGRYHGPRSKLIRATEVVGGDLDPCEEAETVFGTFELGGES